MGNSNSPFLAKEEGERPNGAVAHGPSSGHTMLKVGLIAVASGVATVAGLALLTWGSWRFLSGSAAAGAGENEAERRIPKVERLKGNTAGDRGRSCLGSDQGINTALKILSYNVWSIDVMLQDRMDAIGDLIQKHSPDFICFQEVTPTIYKIFENSTWWGAYYCSTPPEKAYRRKYFCMQLSKLPAAFFQKRIGPPRKERELWITEVDAVETPGGKSLAVATAHLVSPHFDFHHQGESYCGDRIFQVKHALSVLKSYPNVVLGGDLNWDEERDGLLPLPHGWFDAWEEKRPGGEGWTFDTVANPMLSCNYPLRKRLDRFLCRLEDFSIIGVEMIGTEEIPGVFYCKEKRVGRVVVSDESILPVLPSDHFGLLLTIEKINHE